MDKPINTEILKQYIDIFGKEKMLAIFTEYKTKVNNDNAKIIDSIANNDLNSIRIIYHSLASASLVFGMQNFATICKEIEERTLQGTTLEALQPLFEKSLKSLEQEKKQVEDYLEKPNE